MRKTIAELAQDEDSKRCHADHLAQRNVYGLGDDERRALAVAYAEARAEHYKALAALEEAIGGPLNPMSGGASPPFGFHSESIYERIERARKGRA